jgi:hypothetical protein
VAIGLAIMIPDLMLLALVLPGPTVLASMVLATASEQSIFQIRMIPDSIFPLPIFPESPILEVYLWKSVLTSSVPAPIIPTSMVLA